MEWHLVPTLAIARELCEVDVAMSGKTVEEMEQEVQREKELTQKQQAITKKARKERWNRAADGAVYVVGRRGSDDW
eukprot:CAMPEP_0183728380 /NCGR_PEP_ID=MMETSP0737-20130205/27919_1 /TAXON_ID=385413 /ORGANISM="Thalassiosira miniscula, Strain CCMP1093" /LENGTH=75 /DNA_ID=CAMNT_0025960307 /DNA_START=315 /DNA_END=542 /DNA_ORIENTATION=-